MKVKKVLVTALYPLSVIIYTLVGGAVFYAIENPLERANIQVSKAQVSEILSKFPCINETQLYDLVATVGDLHANALSNSTDPEPSDWTYLGCIFFATTIITTIGYGNIAPSVMSSRMFACFYAIFGIPLCLLFLSNVGDLLHKINNTVTGKLVKWPDTEKRKQYLKLSLMIVVGITFLVFIPSIGFTVLEGWWYYEGFYFSIITMSTVGLGDYVPGFSNAPSNVVQRLLTMLWVYFGLAWFSAMLNARAEMLTLNSEKENQVAVTDVQSQPTNNKELTSPS